MDGREEEEGEGWEKSSYNSRRDDGVGRGIELSWAISIVSGREEMNFFSEAIQET